jgi:spermidine synthase
MAPGQKRRMDRRAFAASLLAAAAGAGPAAAQSSRYGRVERRESQYTTIYVDRDGPYVTMRFGVNDSLFTESRYNPADPAEMPLVYTRYMTVALTYLGAEPRSILEIGLGGGRTASYFHDFLPQTHVTVAELDPEVIALAQRHFGVRQDARLRLVERDGRIFARASRERYDMIMVDAYRGTFVPFHLTTREFFQIVKGKLAPGGVVAQNIAPDVLDPDAMVATTRAVFDHVDTYDASGSGSIVLVAYDGPAKTGVQLRARAAALQSARRLRYPLADMLADRTPDARSTARVLTDDFAPVGYRRDR